MDIQSMRANNTQSPNGVVESDWGRPPHHVGHPENQERDADSSSILRDP
jgi:hypothetical protein